MVDATSRVQLLSTAQLAEYISIEIVNCHRLGVLPGDIDEPWTKEFHDRAVVTYRRGLPDWYIDRLAVQIADAVTAIQLIATASPITLDFTQFVSNASRAFCPNAKRRSLMATLPRPDRPEVALPGLAHIENLATLVSRDGALISMHAMADARREIATHAFGVTTDEMYVADHVSRGIRRIDIAVALVISERSVYRLQQSFTKKLRKTNFPSALRAASDAGLFPSTAKGSDRFGPEISLVHPPAVKR